MTILRNTTDVYKSYRHIPWCSLCMFIKGVHGYSYCNTRGGYKLEKIRFFGVKSWFFTRNTPKHITPPSARHNFFKCAPPTPLTWNPGSAPEYWWTSFQHFKVPEFREILPPSEQNRIIKSPSLHTKFWINISRSIFI
jgi:hypothetical protein